MRTTSSFVLGLPLVLGLVAAGCGGDDDGALASTTLLVTNNSDFAIVELYLTDVGSVTWGRNLLGSEPLLPDEQVLLGVTCGFYDALLVDEAGVDCQINDIDLCLNDADWVIENDTCTVFEAGAAVATGQRVHPLAVAN